MTSHLDIYGMLACKLFRLHELGYVYSLRRQFWILCTFYMCQESNTLYLNQKSISFFHKQVNIIKLHLKVQWYSFWCIEGNNSGHFSHVNGINIQFKINPFLFKMDLFKLQIIVLVPAISATPNKSCSGEITARQRHCMGCLNKKPSSLKTKESRQYYIFDFQ